jgi:hypothetical protein
VKQTKQAKRMNEVNQMNQEKQEKQSMARMNSRIPVRPRPPPPVDTYLAYNRPVPGPYPWFWRGILSAGNRHREWHNQIPEE